MVGVNSLVAVLLRANGVLLVFDVTDRGSFDSLNRWHGLAAAVPVSWALNARGLC